MRHQPVIPINNKKKGKKKKKGKIALVVLNKRGKKKKRKEESKGGSPLECLLRLWSPAKHNLVESLQLSRISSPSRQQSHDRELAILFPLVKRKLLLQRLDEALGQQRKHLVGLGLCAELVAGADNGPRELLGGQVGAAGEVEVQAVVVAEQLGKLDAHDAALCEQRAVLLDEELKVLGQLGVLDDDGLAEQRAVLGAADPEDVGEVEHVVQRHVVHAGGEGGADAGAVGEEQQAVCLTEAFQGRQLGLCVDGADLGGVGDVDEARARHVREVPVVVEGLGQRLGRQLAVPGRHVDDLVAAGLDGARLARDDVAGAAGNDGLMGPQAGRDGDCVGRGAAGHEEDAHVVAAEVAADQLAGCLAVRVVAIADLLRVVAEQQGVEDVGMGALAVVVGEAVLGLDG